MTAVAIKDGVVAADSSRWHGELCFSSAKKIHRLGDGSLITSAGSEELILAVQEWLEFGMPQDNKPDMVDLSKDGYTVLWLTADGMYRFDGTLNYVGEAAPFMAGGCHADFLMGAMAAGASAEEAVALAIEHCAFARGPLQVERL